MNSTEWEISLEFHEFDQTWMRYALGQDSRQTNHQVIKIADESVECNLSFSCKNEQKAFYKIIKD